MEPWWQLRGARMGWDLERGQSEREGRCCPFPLLLLGSSCQAGGSWDFGEPRRQCGLPRRHHDTMDQ